MPKSLIRKNQLHPDIADLISGYGEVYFINEQELNSGLAPLTQAIQNNNISGAVLISGNQVISGIKTFNSRPLFNGSGLATTGEIGGSTIFSGNRTITRTSFPNNINVGGNDIATFLNNLFFPFQPATISLGSYSLQELGNTYSNIPYVVTINQNAETSIYNLELFSGSSILRQVVTPSFGTNTYYITPTALSLKNTATLKAKVSGNNNGSPTELSSEQQIEFVAPSWYGTGVNGIKTGVKNMTKYLNTKGNRTFTFNTLDGYFYYAYPSGFGQLSSIIDPSNFTITNAFSSTTDSLTLSDGTSHPYRIYQSINSTTNSNFNITFNF
jgi:hypothetical protein